MNYCSPAVDTLDAPLSGIMPWKTAKEYRSLKVKTSDSFSQMKLSFLVIAYITAWSLRIDTVLIPSISPMVIQNVSLLYDSCSISRDVIHCLFSCFSSFSSAPSNSLRNCQYPLSSSVSLTRYQLYAFLLSSGICFIDQHPCCLYIQHFFVKSPRVLFLFGFI